MDLTVTVQGLTARNQPWSHSIQCFEMNPKDLFQTGLRIAGVILIFYMFPQALGDLISLFAPGPIGGGFVFYVSLLLRIIWDVAFPLWLVCGAKGLTLRLYGSA